MKAKPKGQNSLGFTTGPDVYEIRPRKCRDGIELISDRFRYGPIWYAGPDAIRNAAAYAKYRSLALAPGNYPSSGRLRDCDRDPRLVRFVLI
jgi:hypothetical protein